MYGIRQSLSQSRETRFEQHLINIYNIHTDYIYGNVIQSSHVWHVWSISGLPTNYFWVVRMCMLVFLFVFALVALLHVFYAHLDVCCLDLVSGG